MRACHPEGVTAIESGAAVVGDRVAVRRDSGFEGGDDDCLVYDDALIVREQRKAQVPLLPKLVFNQV